jgi:hypothetical protein
MISPYPTPPISRSGSPTSSPLVTGHVDGALEHGLSLCERRFGSIGKEARTSDVFQAVINSRKGEETAFGQVWLDGETVSLLCWVERIEG